MPRTQVEAMRSCVVNAVAASRQLLLDAAAASLLGDCLVHRLLLVGPLSSTWLACLADKQTC